MVRLIAPSGAVTDAADDQVERLVAAGFRPAAEPESKPKRKAPARRARKGASDDESERELRVD